eukprot:1156600-Pelagomonas_calceolata.AAC.5
MLPAGIHFSVQIINSSPAAAGLEETGGTLFRSGSYTGAAVPPILMLMLLLRAHPPSASNPRAVNVLNIHWSSCTQQ